MSGSHSPPSRTDPETLHQLHQRYEDTAHVIFRQNQNRREPVSYLTLGESSKHYAYSHYGNAAVVIRKSGRDVTKMDEKSIASTICLIM